jgi:hypothetical protein
MFLSPLWTIRTLAESSIHIPDISAENFHCFAKMDAAAPPPEHYVQGGAPHPTIQFGNLDFFKYPFVHVKAQWVDRPKGNMDVVWDSIYRMPPKTSLEGLKTGGAGAMMSSIDWKTELVKNILKPGGVSYVQMKKICVPPDAVKHRLLVTVTPTDSDLNDVHGGPTGMGVYSVKHSFGFRNYLHQLNKGISFF